MEITSYIAEEATVLACTGRLNMVSANHLREAVRGVVADGATRVVVDLAETTFIDSSGLGALIAGLKETRQVGGDLRIAAAGEQVRTVLRLTSLDQVLKPYDDVATARQGW